MIYHFFYGLNDEVMSGGVCRQLLWCEVCMKYFLELLLPMIGQWAGPESHWHTPEQWPDTVLILTTAQCHPVWGGAAMRLSSDENTGNSLELVLLPTLFEGSGPWSLSVSGRVRVPSLRSPLHTNILCSASIICEPVTAAHTLLLPPHNIVTSMTCDQWDTCGTCHGADETARSGASSTVS